MSSPASLPQTSGIWGNKQAASAVLAPSFHILSLFLKVCSSPASPRRAKAQSEPSRGPSPLLFKAVSLWNVPSHGWPAIQVETSPLPKGTLTFFSKSPKLHGAMSSYQKGSVTALPLPWGIKTPPRGIDPIPAHRCHPHPRLATVTAGTPSVLAGSCQDTRCGCGRAGWPWPSFCPLRTATATAPGWATLRRAPKKPLAGA